MPSLLNMLPNAVAQRAATAVYAEVVSPAPASFVDPLFVVMPDWSVDFPIVITDWPAVHGTTLPLVDDAVLLVTDNRGISRCVWWDGQMTFETQSSQIQYLSNTGSDVASRIRLTPSPFNPDTAVPLTGLTNGELVATYITQPGVPGTTFLPAGQFALHIHAAQTAGSQTVQTYAQFWEYDGIGAMDVALIGTTQTSEPFTLDETDYALFLSTSDVYAFISPQSRISVRVYVLVGGTGGANAEFFVGGASDSHVIYPVGNNAPIPAPIYTVATLPAASTVPNGTIVLVSDGGAGAHFQGSIGSAWVNLG